MRLLVCGDRWWTDQSFINGVLDQIHEGPDGPIEVVIEGEANGADKMGRVWAESRGVPFLPFPANWRLHGRAAGPIRNRKQFDEGHPTYVAAFHDCISGSKGTKDMVGYAKSKGCPTQVYSH
jgi:hypothetical protein